MGKTILKYIFILIFMAALTAPVFAEEEAVLDMPDFSGAGKSTKNFFSKGKQKAADIKNKSIEKIDTAKEKAGNALLKTGTPTGGTPKGLTRKEREELILKYRDNGYYGTLPNIEREFDYLKQKSRKISPDGRYKDSFIDEENLKKAPLDDELFLDVILKKEKDTKFTKDAVKMIPLLNNFKNCIENNCDIQRFNANVNTVDLYARRLEKDYGMTPDSQNESFYLIQNIAYLAKLQGNLKYEANFYSKYMPLSGTVYASENIEKRDYELLMELNKTIFTLEQLK